MIKAQTKYLTRHMAIAFGISVVAMNLAYADEQKAATKAPIKNAAKPSMQDVLKASKASDWRPLDPQNTLYLEMDKGRVVIELVPEFAPKNIENIKKLVREGYFDGLAMIRSQDNYVAQWGDADEKREFKTAAKTVDGEFTVKYSAKSAFTRLPDHDGYAPQVGHAKGFAAGRDPKSRTTWLAHCYGAIGVARGNETNSGNGSSLYAVTGHAPRNLDRNITVVGKVMQGMELLSTLPRGTGALGFYEKAEERTPIKSVRIAADVPEAERSKLEVFRTDTASFQALVEAQRNRGGEWYKFAANHIELCNVPVPVRTVK
ncbi:peptidylprolyl isomerase [Undibacterium cyanobacteriorum]|uniref:peptidylprolyl isomerase n=1 Tax=Undibacterium cyanobacteriorum TaxID=3073561 RepID=A0ABY9RL57_9BURK|nr:peptidylprolyl isomerase [Undibacterium sp. 20NA77.5]WMW81932.1 peptidylprolyl isomerase [Undibacterium sp. 20NA77.5]